MKKIGMIIGLFCFALGAAAEPSSESLNRNAESGFLELAVVKFPAVAPAQPAVFKGYGSSSGESQALAAAVGEAFNLCYAAGHSNCALKNSGAKMAAFGGRYEGYAVVHGAGPATRAVYKGDGASSEESQARIAAEGGALSRCYAAGYSSCALKHSYAKMAAFGGRYEGYAVVHGL